VVRPSRTNASIARARGVRRLPTPDCASGASAVAPLGSQAIAHACRPPLWRCKPSAARWPSACHIHLAGPEWGPLHTGGDASELGPVVRALSVGVYRRQTTTGWDRRRADCQAVAPDPASGGTCRLCHTTSNGCALANRHRLAPIAPKRRRPRRGASSCRAAACLTFDTPSHERSHSWSSPASPQRYFPPCGSTVNRSMVAEFRQ
jgi:hypothetical protein